MNTDKPFDYKAAKACQLSRLSVYDPDPERPSGMVADDEGKWVSYWSAYKKLKAALAEVKRLSERIEELEDLVDATTLNKLDEYYQKQL